MRKVLAGLLLFFPVWLYAEDYSFDEDNSFDENYSFDVEEYETKLYEIRGNFTANAAVMYNNRESRLYKLKYYNRKEPVVSDIYHFRPELFFKFNYAIFSFNTGGNADIFNIDNQWDHEELLYECSINLAPANFSFDIGKKSMIWGKGYIWNPVSFAGRQKNADDVDAALEGFWLLNAGWNKSFDSKLSNLAFNFVVLPSYENINEDFENIFTDYENLDYENDYFKTTHFITRVYFLFFNTDIDLYLLLNHRKSNKAGVDFSRNLLSNWEIHAEYSYENNYHMYYMNETGMLEYKIGQVNNFLAGTRYLTGNEITLIFEYLHNDGGYTKDQTDIFYSEVETSLETGMQIPYYKKSAVFLNRQFVSKDYFYLKITKPQPFDLLYFTPSANFIYNVTDGSLASTLEFKYTGITNLEIALKGSYLYGWSSSQYGEKTSGQKHLFQLRYYF